jgi:hypothetical protein
MSIVTTVWFVISSRESATLFVDSQFMDPASTNPVPSSVCSAVFLADKVVETLHFVISDGALVCTLSPTIEPASVTHLRQLYRTWMTWSGDRRVTTPLVLSYVVVLGTYAHM